MAAERQVAVLVGSLRQASLNRKMARALQELGPKTLHLGLVEIGGLPLYNEDEDASPPPAWTEFRQAINAAAAVLFVTPEYDRSIPGALKNAIDVGSRPYGASVWARKPAVRQCFVFLDMPAMQQPEAYIGGAAQLFDSDGRLANEGTRAFLTSFLQAFAAWVGLHSSTPACTTTAG